MITILTHDEFSRIVEIKGREQAATDGPWEVIKKRGDISVFPVFDGCSADWQGWYSEPDIEDATFIAASRMDIPFLLSLVEKLQQNCCTKSNDMLQGYSDVLREKWVMDQFNPVIGDRQICMLEEIKKTKSVHIKDIGSLVEIIDRLQARVQELEAHLSPKDGDAE